MRLRQDRFHGLSEPCDPIACRYVDAHQHDRSPLISGPRPRPPAPGPRLVGHNARRQPHSGCPIGNVGQYHRHRPDAAAVAHAHVFLVLGIGAEIDLVTQDRHSAVIIAVADCHALPERANFPDDGVRVDEDPPEMPDAQALSYHAGFRQAYACHRLRHPEQKPIDKEKSAFKEARWTPVHAPAKTVDPYRPQRLFLQPGPRLAYPGQVRPPGGITSPEHGPPSRQEDGKKPARVHGAWPPSSGTDRRKPALGRTSNTSRRRRIPADYPSSCL